ncbi:hypothetical protein HNQ85_003488 [Anoxybacillus calidus]|uniref:Uncharacterized protein n=1 Tax=[Anoxybacillus] calidus TaxID=575178 RepID=A0A7V9Z3A8_9BACL|nr:hypothetical protein [Anoxybacillus calidus]MBA2873150.1 hypothetical protein [Anoxybacillus calidus]
MSNKFLSIFGLDKKKDNDCCSFEIEEVKEEEKKEKETCCSVDSSEKK